MKRPRIFSDFAGPFQPDYMLLGYMGTLRDLNVQQIVLSEGLEVTVYSESDEIEDLEIDGAVMFGLLPDKEYPECWFVQTDPASLRHVKVERDKSPFTLPCFRCRTDIYAAVATGRCPVCGLDIEFARRRLTT